MVKICQTGLLKLNFETRPKKRIFRFLPKISAGHGWSWKFFFANFQILGPLGCHGWVVIPQNVKKKSQNHCTLMKGYGWNFRRKSRMKGWGWHFRKKEQWRWVGCEWVVRGSEGVMRGKWGGGEGVVRGVVSNGGQSYFVCERLIR